jgi:probable selenate reductase FAD-binding subunit
MLAHLKEFHRPDNLESAVRLLNRSDVRTVPLAGGVALIARADPTIEAVVDLRDLGLDYIRQEERTFHIGATLTLQWLVDAPQLQGLAGGLLCRAARRTVNRIIRNMATVGGAIASGDHSSPLLLALLALDAQVQLRGFKDGLLPLGDIFADPQSYLGQGVLITEIVLPAPPTPPRRRGGKEGGLGGGLAWVGRTPSDRPIVSAATTLVVTDGLCHQARLALGGVARRPTRLLPVEKKLEGHPLSEESIAAAAAEVVAHIAPPSDFRGSSEYRREMAAVMARRALLEAWEGHRGLEDSRRLGDAESLGGGRQ